MVKQALNEKDYLPILESNITKDTWPLRRAQLRKLLETWSYGKTPDVPVKVTGRTDFVDEIAYAGKVRNEKITITLETDGNSMSFPLELFIPYSRKKPPVILHLAFRPVPDRYIPVEEITDEGFALAVVVYTDLMNDNHHGDFSGGIAALLGTTGERQPDQWGKIGMWAYGASRILDYLIAERSDLDTDKVAVMGHSRLGKTALWCAAQDERFACAISNNSGYGGASSSKHGKGERVADFIRVGSWDWYCENFKLFTGDLEDRKPYDQSFLLALIAPRLLCVGSAMMDRGADPESEFLTTAHASVAWELQDKKGLIHRGIVPSAPVHLAEGNISYHLRPGRHFLSREDWGKYMRFLRSKWMDDES